MSPKDSRDVVQLLIAVMGGVNGKPFDFLKRNFFGSG